MLMLAAHHLGLGGIHRIETECAEQADLHLRQGFTKSHFQRYEVGVAVPRYTLSRLEIRRGLAS
ncbi:hypothetical protein ACVWZ6_002522 [Bradyrhizobium sp. GM6.1]